MFLWLCFCSIDVALLLAAATALIMLNRKLGRSPCIGGIWVCLPETACAAMIHSVELLCRTWYCLVPMCEAHMACSQPSDAPINNSGPLSLVPTRCVALVG